MATSKIKTVDQYLSSLEPDRRKALQTVRDVILKNLPNGYEETLNWGMISYEIPLKKYPNTYNKQPLAYAALASQKNYMSLYLMGVYGDEKTQTWFKQRYAESGKKLDMGKSCLRFRKVEDLPLDLIGETIARIPVDAYLRKYEAAQEARVAAGRKIR